MTTLVRFFQLLLVDGGPDVFNPWTRSDPYQDGALNGPQARRRRLRAHLAVAPARILVGEACGYQGCHVSGIAFTSERLILSGVIPRVSADGPRLSLRPLPWSEPSATTVWGTLHALGIAHDTVLWNAFPWHPHRPGDHQSNRTPSRIERERGLVVLEALLQAAPGAQVFAVGRHAEQALRALGRDAVTLRHPSMGGAAKFRDGLRRALRSGNPTGATRRRGTPR